MKCERDLIPIRYCESNLLFIIAISGYRWARDLVNGVTLFLHGPAVSHCDVTVWTGFNVAVAGNELRLYLGFVRVDSTERIELVGTFDRLPVVVFWNDWKRGLSFVRPIGISTPLVPSRAPGFVEPARLVGRLAHVLHTPVVAMFKVVSIQFVKFRIPVHPLWSILPVIVHRSGPMVGGGKVVVHFNTKTREHCTPARC